MKITGIHSLFTAEQIQARVRELAGAIDKTYGEEPLVVVCVLNGAFMFFADLVRHLHNRNLILDFVRLSSYGSKKESSRHVTCSRDVEVDIRDCHVLVVEDIVDSGHTMRFLFEQFEARKPRSLRLAALVDKHERREINISVDFPGFALNDGFLVGYGLDFDKKYRALPDICVLEYED